MSIFTEEQNGTRHLLMGNEAIVRGAIEAGLDVAAGYPGTPSSEIIETLAKYAEKNNHYVEWSVNEKVALEVAAAGSFSGLRSLAVMKQPGLNVASDFLLHLSASGTRGPMVLLCADDPGALSSINEGETRFYARLMEIPLIEPGNFQEAKDMMKWAFELSEEIRNIVLVRTVTRLSHASGNVTLGERKESVGKAFFKNDGFILDPMEGSVMSAPVAYKHGEQQVKLKRCAEIFEKSPFNVYEGPVNPELLIITSSICDLYSKEAVSLLNAEKRVGILKLGTTFPLPPKLIEQYLAKADKILIVEEVLPFLEESIKVLAAELAPTIGAKQFFGKANGDIPMVNELNPDIVVTALSSILGIEYKEVDEEYKKRASEICFFGSPARETTFCPGCPHRASFFSINKNISMDNRSGFTCGDIGCYSMGMLPGGFSTLKTLHAMGSGTGLASGFGKMTKFGMEQPVVSVCGDSTFFHSAMPPLVNAIHNNSNLTMIVLDNSGTAMTGFQPHPGLEVDATGSEAPKIDIPSVCKGMGVNVEVCDPFDLAKTQETLFKFLESDGVNVLVLKQICALSPEKKGKKMFNMSIDDSVCLGGECGCNKMCTRVLSCPGLIWDRETEKSTINDVICIGCGVCASVCPSGAIKKEEA
ncbi:MAG: indolepyruvate ferredoxin oxidoreductase [Desulfobacterales bacterium]|nr:indolepyruvate ferredoxin oxidoreductase [Desulfobacterales bacterium]MCP4158498.1 indolepyruvate ferredoxin oxidoreductase [Deltaproteobacteria bacterium]